MIELGQLERQHAEFAHRKTRVVVISIEGRAEAERTQIDFPHLLVVADQSRGLSDAAGLIHAHAAPDGGDADAPTTILVDRRGMVRWLYRSEGVLARLAPEDVLQAIDTKLPRDDQD